MARSLVTGIAGFAGSHLADFLVSRGDEVQGIDREGAGTETIQHLLERKQIRIHPLDIRDRAGLADLIHQERFDRIYHLASLTFIPESFVEPEETLAVNLGGTMALFEATRAAAPSARILYVSSAAAYGDLDDPTRPVVESTPFRPNNPYGFTKAAGDLMAYQYARQNALHIVRARPFNHTGPRQAPVFVCSEFAKAVAEMEAGHRPPELSVGNLEIGRDFSDVRDIVRGYVMILERGSAGSCFNLASGRAVKVGKILETLLTMSRTEVRVTEDPRKVRQGEVPSIVGSAEKAAREADWRPEFPFDQTLRDLLAWWRARI